MADYAQGRLRRKRRELELALEGTFTEEQRWLLQKELGQVEWLEAQVLILEKEIERRVAGFQEATQRLLTIPGIDGTTAWTIVAEIGVELSAFANANYYDRRSKPKTVARLVRRIERLGFSVEV